jgi:hypothetical protein
LGIAQTKARGVKRIRSLLKKLGLRSYEKKNGTGVTFGITCPALWFYLDAHAAPAGRKSYTVRIPRAIFKLPPEALRALLSGVLGGDGTVTSDYSVVYTASPGFAEDLVELVLRIGRSASVRTVQPRRRKWADGRVSNCRASYVVNVDKEGYHLLSKRSKAFNVRVPYAGEVVCAELPKFHRLYVMRNGKPVWCGNTHEIVRHRVGCSYSQESTRYVNYNKKLGLLVVEPLGLTDAQRVDWLNAMQSAADCYERLVLSGCTPQQARDVLPTCTKADIVFTATFRAWKHFFNLRTSKAAHPKIRVLAGLCKGVLQRECPSVFGEPTP